MFNTGLKLLENSVLCQLKTGFLESIVADGFDRAFFQSRHACSFIGWIVWLKKNVAFSRGVVACEIGGRDLSTDFAVDACFIDEKVSSHIFWQDF